MNKAKELVQGLLSTYWFVPGLICASSLLLAFVMIQIDTRWFVDLDLPWLYISSPDGARSVLSTIAGSVITVAGVSFSIIIVALTVAAAQHGSQIMSLLMRDRGNQVVLGTLTGTFLYCLIVLRTVHGDTNFALNLSLAVGVALAIASIAVVVYLIHHICAMLQVDSLIERVVADLDETIITLYPERLGDEAPLEETVPGELQAARTEHAISCDQRGYLQSWHPEELIDLAKEFGAILLLKKQPGDFLIPGECMATAILRDRRDLPLLKSRILHVVAIGRQRTVFQDVKFPASQLIDIALRSISPANPELITAETCIDEMTACLNLLLQRQYPSRYRSDNEGHLRLVAEPTRFGELFDIAFTQLIGPASGYFRIALRMLISMERLCSQARETEDLQTIRQCADDLLAAAKDRTVSQEHKLKLQSAHARVSHSVSERISRIRAA